MSQTIQYIEKKGHREYAIVPIKLWEKLIDDAEMLDDIRAFDEFKAHDDGFRIPGEIVDAELAGVNSVKAWRTHKGISQKELAGKAGISIAYLNQIESGKRKGTAKTLSKVAKALGVPVDILIPG